MWSEIREISRPQKLVSSIVEELIRIIEKENIPVGGKLPSEKELSDAFGVGRSSIREALQALEAYGIVKTKKGVGRFLINDIKSINEQDLANWLERRIINIPLIKLLEARSVLATAIMELAVENASEEDIEKMEIKYNKFKKARGNTSEFFKKEMEFHQFVNTLCENEILTEVMNTLIQKIFEQEFTLKNTTEKNELEAIRTARRLINAFKSEDARAAQKIIKRHIDLIIEDL